MNRIVAFILLIAFIGQSFNQGLLYVGYLVDKAEYLKNCTNKYRPQLECNGKCILMQRIKEQEKKDRENAPQLKMTEKAEIVSSKSFFPEYTYFTTVTTNNHQPLRNSGIPIDQPSSFFHPPCVS